MKGRDSTEGHLWSVILPGGEGVRLRPFIHQWLGYPLPKQYCTFVGTRSMLQHTLDRADCVSPKAHKVTVVSQPHQHLAWPHLKPQKAGQVVIQPNVCTTAADVFFPLTYVLGKDSQATVVMYPSDHFVFPEDQFVETVRHAIRAAEILRDRLIVLGVRPTHPELDYGWLVRGDLLGWTGGAAVYQVTAFMEKPDTKRGIQAMTRGALWNTSVIAAKASTLWDLGWRCLPELMDRFARLQGVIGTARESQVLQTIYHDMPRYTISSDLFKRIPECVGVMELEGVLWSDWERPEWIVTSLRQIGKEPLFPFEEGRIGGSVSHEDDAGSRLGGSRPSGRHPDFGDLSFFS